MKLNLKSVFLSVGIFVFALVLVGVFSTNKAYANTCTSQSSGDWHTAARWGACGGTFPQSGDTVVIATAHAITMATGDATITALTFNDAVAAANSLTISNAHTLTVSGATTYTATTGAAGSTLAVGDGTFTTGTLVINDGATQTGDMVLSVSTGTINVTGNISGTWSEAADVQFTSTGDSDMNFGGNFPSGATLDDTGGRITFNGTGAQDVGAYTTYNNVTINKTAGTATLLGTTTFGGTLTLTDGNLDTNTRTFTVTGASSITDTITFGTGTKTFTGDVTLNAGAIWNETGAAVVPFAGNLTNNATTFTASTGLHTFSGATKVISGSTTTSIPSVRISGATSNTGTLTAATLLEVSDGITLTNTGTVTATTALSDVGTTGTFVNSTSGTLNIGDVIDISALTATATGNTVNYTKAGAQTAFQTDYRNLGLSGSGAKTMTGITTLTGNFTMSGSATATPVITTIGGNVSITGTAAMTTGAANVVTGTLTVGTGAALHIGGFALTITSTSSITGTVDTVTAATGTKTFTGAVTINAGGVWDLSGQNPATSFAGGITASGTTFNNGSGAAAFSETQALAGAENMTFGGTVTPAVTKTLTNNNTGTVTIAGALTLTGNFTQGTSSNLTLSNATPFSGAGTFTASASGNLVTYTGAAAPVKAATYNNLTLNALAITVDGVTVVNGTMTVSNTVTNNSTLTVTTALAGTSTLTNAATGTLNIGFAGAPGITTLTATATGNTVNYTAASPTCKVVVYDNLTFSGSGTATCAATSVTGDLILSGTVSLAPSGASLTIGDALTVGTGTTFTLPGIAVTVTGATSVTGILNTVTAATGAKTFTGAVTVNTGGVWDLSTTNPGVSFAAGFTVDGSGTFTSGSGAYTFANGAAQTLGGTRAITITTITNSDTTGNGLTLQDDGVTITTLTQGASTVLTFAGAIPTITTLDADTNTNTVQYTGASQAIKADTYSSLTVNGTGTATVGGTTVVNGTMTVSSAVTNNSTLTVTTALSGASTLTNGASATLNIGDASGITGLTATASGNTVNYTKAGAQTVKDATISTYVNLGISGSGAKTITAATIIGGDFTIGGTATATLSGSANTANKLYFGSTLQRLGTHGATAATATYESDTYFTAGATGIVTVAVGISSGGGTTTSGGGGSVADTTPPTNTSISINAGASSTTSKDVTLTLSATGASKMVISNDYTFTGDLWENYSKTKSWTLLSGNGIKTVYAKFKDTAGNVSAPVQDTIGIGVAAPADTITPATPGTIPGCGARTTGFSSSTGASCVGNTGTTTPAATVIPGCGNRATGFSSSSGASCVGNSAGASATTSAGAAMSASARTYNLGTSTLKNGSRGEAAKELQRFLNDKLSMGLVVDGIIGPKSIAVIKTWQKANGLVADGLIGPKTKAKINASVQ